MVLRLISCSPRRSGFFVTVISEVSFANLTPASRRQDHTTSPSASRTAGVVKVICPTPKAKYFCRQDWTAANPADEVICPTGKSERTFSCGTRDDEAFEQETSLLVRRVYVTAARQPMASRGVPNSVQFGLQCLDQLRQGWLGDPH